MEEWRIVEVKKKTSTNPMCNMYVCYNGLVEELK